MEKKLVAFLVDDDLDDQKFFQLAASRITDHLDCKFADSAAHAIDMLNSNEDFNPDFIFLDINMPLTHGIECLRLLRKMERLVKVPIYMYSTSSSEDISRTSFMLGATDVIQKVPSVKRLKEMLSEIYYRQKYAS
jgi:CheY-like chemotaxis protein